MGKARPSTPDSNVNLADIEQAVNVMNTKVQEVISHIQECQIVISHPERPISESHIRMLHENNRALIEDLKKIRVDYQPLKAHITFSQDQSLSKEPVIIDFLSKYQNCADDDYHLPSELRPYFSLLPPIDNTTPKPRP